MPWTSWSAATGEQVFAELVEGLDTGSLDPSTIPGLAFLDGDTPRTGDRAPIPHPRDQPDWNLDLVDVPRYLRRTFLGDRTLGYHSSYGCPYFCNFCAVVNLVNGRWLAQPAERVAATVRTYADRWGVDAVEMNDNNFFVHEARTAEFAERIRDLGVTWWGEGRIDTLLGYDRSSWQAMRDSGLRMVFLGAESGSAETLERMDKGGSVTPEATLEMVDRMRDWGIVPELSFVLGNPPDPEEDSRQTLEFIRRLKRINPDTEIILYLYTPVPLAGTLYDEARASGFALPSDPRRVGLGRVAGFRPAPLRHHPVDPARPAPSGSRSSSGCSTPTTRPPPSDTSIGPSARSCAPPRPGAGTPGPTPGRWSSPRCIG
jgi:anaerobic magnesium-protoporphyrin IX monomethyl ester cyclase